MSTVWVTRTLAALRSLLLVAATESNPWTAVPLCELWFVVRYRRAACTRNFTVTESHREERTTVSDRGVTLAVFVCFQLDWGVP